MLQESNFGMRNTWERTTASHIRISEIGIDFVERVMSHTLDKTQDEALKQKLKLILNDPSPSSRIRRFLDLTNSYSSHTGLIMNVVKKLLKQSSSKLFI